MATLKVTNLWLSGVGMCVYGSGRRHALPILSEEDMSALEAQRLMLKNMNKLDQDATVAG